MVQRRCRLRDGIDSSVELQAACESMPTTPPRNPATQTCYLLCTLCIVDGHEEKAVDGRTVPFVPLLGGSTVLVAQTGGMKTVRTRVVCRVGEEGVGGKILMIND